MASRSFRQRPIEINKPLELVRDLSLLDSAEGLPTKEAVAQSQAEAAAKKEAAAAALAAAAAAAPAHGKPGVHEIPIPGVTKVPTYDVDYLPAFRERNTYLRGRGGTGYDDSTYVEYDLDVEDEAWLKQFNGEQERLSEEKFEAMLWRLDVANAEATDKVYAFQGTALADRYTPEACASTIYYPREDALQMLEENCPTRESIRVAVYEYWLQKREKLKAPLLRRLQAPTPLNNQDPFRVFRPRERIHRPQTRRRRENNEDSFQRLQTISDNIRMALQLFELVVKRERKKRDMTYAVTDWQQLQIKQKHQPRAEQDAIEQEYQAAAKNKSVRRPVGFEKLPEAAPAATNALFDFRNKKNKKRKRLGMEAQLHAVAQLPPPVLPPQPSMLFTSAGSVVATDFEQGKLQRPATSSRQGRPASYRFGRGGRLVMDRCKPFTWEPLENEDADGEVKPMHELGEFNKYAAWTGKDDLVRNALAKMDGGGPSTVVKLRLSLPGPGAGAAAAGAPNGDAGKEETAQAPQGTPAAETPAPAPAATTGKPTRSSSRTRMAS